jgi:class 3 adenylate cyclase/tetratricopeptide (TPR) repeat protein
MYCSQCQLVNPEGARFCNACGARIESVCPACGQVPPPGSRFCNTCGHSLAPPAPLAPAPSGASPQPYTPKHLAERILTRRSALEGERKQVTVLFGDVADSSRLAQRLDPEVMHQLMDQVLRLMAEAVHRYEGTVNQYLGDGLMALFGAPIALEDHAFRAVQAALTIQETISGYSTQFQRDHGIEVRIRVGLNTGLVVVGRIGDDLRMDYTAVGNTTHLAARLQVLAEPGTILITETTYRLVAGYIRSEAMGPVEVKGQHALVQVYKVAGRRRWRSRLEISAERGLTPLVGRQRELTLLDDCLTRAEGGRGQVVGIVGEAGVGKSRLLYEFHTSLAGGRVHWLTGHCVAYGQTTPYLPFLEILRANFQIEEEDNPLQIQEKLRQGVHLLDESLAATLPFLEALFGLRGADDALRHLEPKDKRQQTFEAIRALASAGSQRQPHVLVFENLHWLDQTSEDCLTMLVESLAGFPILVLTTHRPGYTVRWADKTYYTQIAPDLLTNAEAEAMVAALLGSRALPPGLLRCIQEKASGNPLFIEEVTRVLVERGLLGRENGGFTWTSDAEVAFPDTIQDIMRARIDRLQEPVKRTVQTAAVIGREFGLRLLTRISEWAAVVPQDLETLKQAELIHERRVFPELVYCFKHAVIQDVAYESLLLQRRQALHGAIGQAIAELYADRLEEQAAVLAYHYARSAHQDRAVTYALVAGDRAARLYARAEATTYYEQALTMARALPSSPEAQRAQIDAILKLASVGMTRQDLERDGRNLEQAHALAEALADVRRLAQVLYWQGRILYALGDPQTALGHARQSLAIADRLGDEALAAPSTNLMGRISWYLSDYVNASQQLARSTEQMRRLGNTTEEATAAAFAGLNFGFIGEFTQALAYADHGLRLAREIRNPFAESAAYHYRGMIHNQRGAWTQAITDCEEARRVAERTGDRFRVYLVQFFEGRAHTMDGNTGRGRELLAESIALSAQLGTTFGVGMAKAYQAECLLARGERDAVPPLCHEAIGLAEETGDKYAKALAHRTLAEALFALAPADPQDAERAMLEAIRLQQEIGNQPELARSYMSYARLLQGWGEAAKASEYLTRAISMFQQMDMAWDLTRAEQVLQASQ